jgi:hypothetical protein
MISNQATITVTSHVGRDLLSSASLFKTEAAVVWEYVVNSLQYVDSGIAPKVQVLVKPRAKTIEIRDNGRGMTGDDLNRYFQMHAENVDRLKGRPGRGKFGTGKAAAFGIGDSLNVDTRRDGLRNVVRLERERIAASEGGDIAVESLVSNQPTDLPNGTTITIGDIFLPRLNTTPIIEYIERHLQTYRAQQAEVSVNEHLCEFKEPSFGEVFTFEPNPEQRRVLGDVALTIKVSVTPLSVNERGVSVTAGAGNLVALETAGIENKELGSFLFGEIDVPALETTDTPVEAYDSTRSLQLNPMHPVVRVLVPFIGSKLEEVRAKQVSKLREAQKSEAARRLAKQASAIAELLNDDFHSLVGKLREISSAAASPGRLGQTQRSNVSDESAASDWLEGLDEPGTLEPIVPPVDGDPKSSTGHTAPEIPRAGRPDSDGDASVSQRPVSEKREKKSKSGFSVRFDHLGAEENRSVYDKASLTILINLDHPVVAGAAKSGTDDLNFRRLAFEIAFTEYAIALGYEIADQDPEIPADDLLFEVRAALNRISARAADLYH